MAGCGGRFRQVTPPAPASPQYRRTIEKPENREHLAKAANDDLTRLNGVSLSFVDSCPNNPRAVSQNETPSRPLLQRER